MIVSDIFPNLIADSHRKAATPSGIL